MINIFNCKISKEKEELSEKIKRNVKEYRCIFFNDFFIGFSIVILITFFMGYFDWLSQWIKVTDKIFEIIVTIIGFLGILLGFLLTALGVIISGVQNRFQNETDKKEKDNKLNEYWKYLIIVSKSVIFLLLSYILVFIVLLAFIETIKFYDLQLFLLAWSVLSTIMICYLTFDRIFDYYENPF